MSQNDSRPAIAFAAPAQQKLFRAYGDPRASEWEAMWMMLWHIQNDFPWFPAKTVYIHKDFRGLLIPAFSRLEEKGLHLEIRSYDGCFNVRHVRGSYSVLSTHSWGAAIDLNARENPLGSSGRWSGPFLDVLSSCGIFCGQRWTGRKDPMHFAMVNG